MANDEEVSSENDEEVSNEDDEKISAHLDAANKAVDFLRERNIHLPFCRSSKEGIEVDDKFLVNNGSNLMVRSRFNKGVNKKDTQYARILMLVSALLHCGSHLSAWDFHFPTVVEM